MIFDSFDKILDSGIQYPLTYWDPPWQYRNFKNHSRLPGEYSKYSLTPYEGMNIEEIKQLPVNQITPKNAVCLLWVTYPCLEWGIEVLKAWGFKFRTVAFTWVKLTKNGKYFVGLGNYTRTNPEIVLLGKKGKGLPVVSKKVRNLVVSRITKHSEKPPIVRDRILELFGDVDPRLEGFSRHEVPGWDVFGNQVKWKPLKASLFN